MGPGIAQKAVIIYTLLKWEYSVDGIYLLFSQPQQYYAFYVTIASFFYSFLVWNFLYDVTNLLQLVIKIILSRSRCQCLVYTGTRIGWVAIQVEHPYIIASLDNHFIWKPKTITLLWWRYMFSYISYQPGISLFCIFTCYNPYFCQYTSVPIITELVIDFIQYFLILPLWCSKYPLYWY